MRAQWRALRESLVRSVGTLAAHRQFGEIGQRDPAFQPFADPLGLLDYLAHRGGDRDEKDRIYAALVRAVQARAPYSSLASTLLMLGLWPALDSIYRQHVRRFPGDPGELVSQITGQFTEAVQRLTLGRVVRIAATLTWNTGRLVTYRCVKQDREDRNHDELPGDDVLADRSSRSECSQEESASLRAALVLAIGARDADLLIATEILEETQRAFAKRVGLDEQMVRKRHQRALRKLRDRCPTQGRERRVYLAEATSSSGRRANEAQSQK